MDSLVGMSAEEFKILIESAIKDKSKLAKDAVRVVKPAKREPGASIVFNNSDKLQIRAETVQAMPRYVSEPDDLEFIEDYTNIEMMLRATDLDSTQRGWAVVIPELGDKRIRLLLDPTIDPEELYEKRRGFKGDATIIFKYNNRHEKVQKLIFLRKITG